LVAVVQALVEAGFRQLAFAHHPDRGGDPDRMKQLNCARDWVRRWA
jgi:hypothetical protein